MKQASEDERYKDFHKIRGDRVTVTINQAVGPRIEVGGKIVFVSQIRNPQDDGWQLQLTMDIDMWEESEQMTEEYYIELLDKLKTGWMEHMSNMPEVERRRAYEGHWITGAIDDEDE